MGAGKGGDVDAAAAAEAAQPVVLKMDLHCAGCAHKVKKAIKRVPGVESVVADVAAKRVVVVGTADAAALKARIEAKTGKAVEVVSAGSGPKKAAAASESNKDGGAGEKKADKDGGAGEKKADKDGGAGDKKADKDGGAGEKKGDKDASPKEGKEKKQPSEETKPKEESVLLKIRLHCDGCADRIRRRIYKFKGVKDVVLDGNAKDEVKVTGTMDVRALLSYLKEKLNRPVDAVPAGKKDKGGDGGEGKDNKKDKGGDSNKEAGGDDKKGNKAKGIIDTAGPSSTAAAAAFMAPPAEASTFHVPPPYGHVAYPQEGPAASSYYPYYYDMGSSNSSAATYYHQQQYPHPDHEAGQHQAYAPPYAYHMAPPTQLQLFSDENPNACSVM